MALKRNFEDISGLESPFVDEVVNPGTSPAEVERQAVRSNELLLRKQRVERIIQGESLQKPSTPAPTKRDTTRQSVDKKETKFQEALAAAQGR